MPGRYERNPFNRNEVARMRRHRALQMRMEGLTVRQIAQRLGVTEQAARAMLRQAFQKSVCGISTTSEGSCE